MERLCCWRGKAVGCPPICWRSHESLLSRFASEQEAALAMAEHLEAKLRIGYNAV